MKIRAASESDAEKIADIYNDAVVNTTAIWNNQSVDFLNRIKWMRDRKEGGFPVLVATDDNDNAIGYASYGDWRPWEGYCHTVEHSVYVHKDSRGHGVGIALMVELIRQATEQGKHIMVAGIESENEASIALHKKLGFTDAGRVSEVGNKFGRWLDLTFLQLRLDNRNKP
ncbi:GNAT family N-acetyltransferase [Klebsiella variicola]|uniref:GNAT family N-acetyltransferase n=1 Tax=Klebsiella variicola TaxID=244366 RepID=UPI001F37E485|nr:GNAT family N-acetyltransferase [Klebsiella variicola]MDF7641809.1 GNAT family N-acetyltransferase [Klebsiella variicola]